MLKGFKKFSGLNENSRREFVLNFLVCNIPFFEEVGMKKRKLFTMKFDTLNVCQNAWFKCHGIKRSTFFNYKKMFLDGAHKAVNGNSGLQKSRPNNFSIV